MDALDEFQVRSAPATVHYIPDFISADEERRLLRRVYEAPRPRWTQLAHRRLQNWGGVPHARGMLAEPLPGWLRPTVDAVGRLGCFGRLAPNHVLVNEYTAGQGIMPHTDGPLFAPVVATVTLGSHALLDLYTPRRRGRPVGRGGDRPPGGSATPPGVRRARSGGEEVLGTGGEEVLGKDGEEIVGKGGENVRDKDGEDVRDKHGEVAVPEEEKNDDGPPRPLGSVLLERRSLVVLQHAAYHDTLHGIAAVHADVLSPDVLNAPDRPAGAVLPRDTRVSVTVRHVPKVLKVQLRL